MKRRNVLLSFLLVVSFLFAVIGCGADGSANFLQELSQSLGVDVSSGEILTQSDTHGGFHGDGTTVVEIQLTDSDLAKQIEENGNGEWNELPLTDNLTALVYGIHTEESSVGPMIHGGDNMPVIPEVENGYYYFLDRHSQSTDPKDDTKVLGRGSYNFTIAIYDADHQILYYMELDT